MIQQSREAPAWSLELCLCLRDARDAGKNKKETDLDACAALCRALAKEGVLVDEQSRKAQELAKHEQAALLEQQRATRRLRARLLVSDEALKRIDKLQASCADVVRTEKEANAAEPPVPSGETAAAASTTSPAAITAVAAVTEEVAENIALVALRAQVLSAVAASQLVVVSARRRSGKSSQIVQWLADSGEPDEERHVLQLGTSVLAVSAAHTRALSRLFTCTVLWREWTQLAAGCGDW